MLERHLKDMREMESQENIFGKVEIIDVPTQIKVTKDNSQYSIRDSQISNC